MLMLHKICFGYYILYIIYGYGGKDKKIPLFILGVLGVSGHVHV